MYFYATETPDESSLWKIQSNDALVRILRFPRSKIVHPVFPTDAPSTGIDGDPPALLLSVVRPFCDHPDTQRVVSFGSRTFFPAYRMDTGSELWMTDGTIAGTRLFVDCFPGPASSSPVLLASRETRFLFVADHARYGRVLWMSDGTAEGTNVLLPVDRSGHAGSPLVASEAMYFENRVLVAGFYSDSSLRARRFIALQDDSGNVVPSLTEPMELTDVHNFTAVKNQIFFVADDGIRGEELWKLDSVAESTTLVRDILP
jgi:ELWxxDGT repeat protein